MCGNVFASPVKGNMFLMSPVEELLVNIMSE